jgi:CRP-like cAMP-binding protein
MKLRPSIRTAPFLEGPSILRLKPRDRDYLANIATEMRVPANSVLCHSGRPANAIYTVASGTLASYRRRANGTRKVFAFLFAEDVFGLARAGRYVNSVKAITPAVVFHMPTESLAALLQHDGALQFRFLCKATQIVRDAQRQALMTAVRDPVERVAMFLSMLEDLQGETHRTGGPIGIPMARQDVADYLNLPGGTVRAAVDALEDRGVVKRMPPDGIAIVDRAAFAAMVDGDEGMEDDDSEDE